MKLFIATATACLSAVAVTGSVFEYGNAVYAYAPLHCTTDACDVVPSCNRAAWANDIKEYNSKCADDSVNCKINIVNSYGGDIEFWPSKDTPEACNAPASDDINKCNVSIYLDPVNAKAAQAYLDVEGVNSITALIDGRLDGWDQIQTYNAFDGCKFGDFYPNLANLTDVSLKRLAKDTAELYCKEDQIHGVQIDLEPFRDPYVVPMTKYISFLSEAMLDKDSTMGCRNDKHPDGRAVSYFCFAHSQNASFNDALGPNGFYVFSLYDLDPKEGDGGFMYNSPAEFADRMRKEIPYIRKVVGTTAKFQLALPAGASCHEYEQYVPMQGDGCGPACTPLNNTGVTMKDYVQAAFDVLLDEEVTKATNGAFCLDEANESQFLGISWWSYSYQMTYPPMKWFDNEFLPGTPPEDALALIRKYGPLLADGKSTCI